MSRSLATVAGGVRDPGPAPEEPVDANDPVGGPAETSSTGPDGDASDGTTDDVGTGGDRPVPAGRPGDDDAAWASIVANFGERAAIDEPGPRPSGGGPADPDPERLRRLFQPFDRPAPRAGEGRDPEIHPGDPDADLAKAPDAPYVPPPAPPLPPTTADRRAAWAGVIGAPALLLVFLLLGLALPTVVALALVAAFIGGFVYLVWKMPREPRDPYDDGARV